MASILENAPGALVTGGALWPERQRNVKVGFFLDICYSNVSVCHAPFSLLLNFCLLCSLVSVPTSSMEEENESRNLSCFLSIFLCPLVAYIQGCQRWGSDWLDLYGFASEWMWKLCSSQQLVPDHPSSYNWVPSWAWYLCAPFHLSIWAIPGFCFAGCVQLHNIPWTDRAVPPVTC